jgi:aryl-alcohol dehydrogenase-like predicted oxidoreductase
MRIIFEGGHSSQLISKLGFGTWGLGGSAYGQIDIEHAQNLVQSAYHRGIRIYDTSPLYGNGRSEKVLGAALEGFDRESFQIVSKYGLYESRGTEYRDFSVTKFHSSLDATLNNLRTNFVDFFLAHSPLVTDYESFANLTEAITRVKLSGKVGLVGVSVKNPADVSIGIDFDFFSAFEFNFSLMDQRVSESVESDTLKPYKKFARTPYNFGFLTDNPPPKSPPLDKSFHLHGWSAQQFEIWHSARKIWLEIADNNGLKLQQLALLFCLSSPKVDFVFPGFMNLQHIEDAIECLNYGRISKESMESLEKTYQEHSAKFVVEKKPDL